MAIYISVFTSFSFSLSLSLALSLLHTFSISPRLSPSLFPLSYLSLSHSSPSFLGVSFQAWSAFSVTVIAVLFLEPRQAGLIWDQWQRALETGLRPPRQPSGWARAYRPLGAGDRWAAVSGWWPPTPPPPSICWQPPVAPLWVLRDGEPVWLARAVSPLSVLRPLPHPNAVWLRDFCTHLHPMCPGAREAIPST